METQGFVVLHDVLSATALSALRDECDALCAALAAEGVAPDDEAEACVVDAFCRSRPPELAPARTQRGAYAAARRAAVDGLCGGAAVEARHAAVEDVILSVLPEAVKIRAGCLGAAPTLYLFNEQHVVKPARSAAAFVWHRDGEEQCAMCPDAQARLPYLSVWCPLDDCGAHNGTLVVRPGFEPWTPPQEDDSSSGGELIELAAGGVCIFSSQLWHASGANASDAPRRAFYAQYTTVPLVCGAERSPLAFAVPVFGT